MIIFGDSMGRGSSEQPAHELGHIDIVAMIEQQRSFDVTAVSTVLGLTDFLFSEIVPTESPRVLAALNSPEMIAVYLEIAPLPGQAIHDCGIFFITIAVAGEPEGTRIVNLEQGKIGRTAFGVETALKFQQLLESASRVDSGV